MSSYTRGTVVQITVSITDSTGTLVDPTTVTAEFMGIDAVVHPAPVTRQSTGVYTYLIDTNLLPAVRVQTCSRKCSAPDGDPAQFAVEGQFTVTTAGFNP